MVNTIMQLWFIITSIRDKDKELNKYYKENMDPKEEIKSI